MNSESVTDHGSLSSSSNPISPAHYLLKLQVYNTSPHFGKGVISLMLLIQQGHSIRSASQVMNMAYSKAWHLIRSAEEDLGFALIIKKKGGSTRAGSVLTPDGQCLLTQFQKFESSVHKCVDQLFLEYFPSAPVPEDD